jgi:DedD protein
MDPALKKRMIGAAVLVVLAIIFVPMLFSGRPPSRTETVDLSLPNPPDREFKTRVVPLEPPKNTPAPAVDPDHVATIDTASTKKPDALEPAAAVPAPTPAKPPAAPPSTPAPPSPAATAAPAPAPEAVPHGRYAVSFGTYAKKDNAEKLVADLKHAGLTAYADSVEANGEPALRVRAGPYADKSEAEKARLIAKRTRADAPGKLVEVDDTPAKDVPAAAVPAKVATGWAVQVGAYSTQGDADAKRDALRKGGFASFVEPIKTEKGTLFRVRVGPHALRADAEKAKAELKEKMKLDGTIVTQP